MSVPRSGEKKLPERVRHLELLIEKQSYFKPRDTIQRVKQSFGERKDLPDLEAKVSVGGRIVGRRKASGSLLFVDLESNGHTVQVMFD